MVGQNSRCCRLIPFGQTKSRPMMAQNVISHIGEPGWIAEFKADAQAARPVPQEIFEHCRVDGERAWQLKQDRSEAIFILERA